MTRDPEPTLNDTPRIVMPCEVYRDAKTRVMRAVRPDGTPHHYALFSVDVAGEWHEEDTYAPPHPMFRVLEAQFGDTLPISDLRRECLALADMLEAKNRAYGDSALNPIRLFSKADPVEQLRVRIDDKLSRLRAAVDGDAEDAVFDLLGYLILLRIATRKENANARL